MFKILSLEKKLKIYGNLFILFISLFFVACSSTQKKIEVNNKIETYEYSNQTLVIPNKFKDKLFTWTKPVKNYSPKSYKIKGYNSKDGNFVIESNQPLYTMGFKDNIQVIKIKYKILSTVQKIDSLNKALNKGIESIVVLPFELINTLTGSRSFNLNSANTIAISIDDRSWYKFYLNKNNFKSEENSFIIEYPFGKRENHLTKKISLAVLSLNGMESKYKKMRTTTFYPDELTYYIKHLDIEKEVIKYNLKSRNNLSLNEDLIRSIAINNHKFFRELQRNRKFYNIQSVSLLKLPIDINIQYGLENFSKIIKTGKYLNYKNRYKSFDVKKIYFSQSNSYKKAIKKLHMDKKNTKPILKKHVNKDTSFVDFDEGI